MARGASLPARVGQNPRPVGRRRSSRPGVVPGLGPSSSFSSPRRMRQMNLHLMAAPTRPGSVRRSDGELMAEVSAGSVKSFGALYDRYCGRAYLVAWAVCRDDGRAQEAVQEAFISVWHSRASYRSQHGTPAAWLLTVVRHRAIDLARSNGRHALRRASDDHLEDSPAADDLFQSAANREDAQRIHALLACLPDSPGRGDCARLLR